MSVPSYLVELTCPHCGGDVEHVADGRSRLTAIAAVCRCTECGAEYLLTVTMTVTRHACYLPPGAGRNPAQCGTDAGYNRHWRRGEPACAACRAAHSTAKRDRKERARRLVDA